MYSPTHNPSSPAASSPASSSKKNVGNQTLSDAQLEDLLRPTRETESKLSSIISTLAPGTVTLLLLSIQQYASAPRALLTTFGQKTIPGTYVTANKPYSDLQKTIPSLPENIQYVDTITALTGKDAPELPRVTYIESPLALVELNLAIAEKIAGIASNQKFLIIDSVSTLLVYNAPQAVEKFCHTVIAKNRAPNLTMVLLMIESEHHHSVVETLSQFVDNVERLR